MIKMYGTNLCPNCQAAMAKLNEQKVPYELINITADTANLKEFILIRDREEMFAVKRENGFIGIPFFVVDGKKTFDVDEAISLDK